MEVDGDRTKNIIHALFLHQLCTKICLYYVYSHLPLLSVELMVVKPKAPEPGLHLMCHGFLCGLHMHMVSPTGYKGRQSTTSPSSESFCLSERINVSFGVVHHLNSISLYETWGTKQDITSSAMV